MQKITISNTFEANKVFIGFDLHDGSIPFAPFELSTSGDIELNPVVLKLSELLELNREIEFYFQGDDSDSDQNPKLALVKETLQEIYTAFNRYVQPEEMSE